MEFGLFRKSGLSVKERCPCYKGVREERFDCNDIPDTTVNIFQPRICYSKMYGTKARFNDQQYDDIPDITNTI